MSNQIEVKNDRVKSLLATEGIRKRFTEILGPKAPAFMSSILSVTNSNKQLMACDPISIISAAAIAASMDLPINQSLGFAYIVPYGNKAQFQVGWKGYIQLAMRSGQYKTINLTNVVKGEIQSYNRLTGEMTFSSERPNTDDTIGYLLYFKLLNGYEKYFYMEKDKCIAHGKRYSKTFAKGHGPWVDDFDTMALKTVAKLGLSKYGILSIEMQTALTFDQAEIAGDVVAGYPDSISERDVIIETERPPSQDSTAPRQLSKLMGAQPETPQAPTKKVIKNHAPGAGEIPI